MVGALTSSKCCLITALMIHHFCLWCYTCFNHASLIIVYPLFYEMVFLWYLKTPLVYRYGVVYKAREKKTGKLVALKRIKMEKEKDGFPITSIREINIMLNFHHPNVRSWGAGMVVHWWKLFKNGSGLPVRQRQQEDAVDVILCLPRLASFL